MLLRLNAVNWQMPDDRIATFERRRHELWIKKVRRPSSFSQYVVSTTGRPLCKSSTSVRLHGHEYKSALYIGMRSGVDRAGTALCLLCTLSWLYKP
jgi:hypothetical protein